MALAGLVARFRAQPIAAVLELGSALLCFLLFIGTFVALATVPPADPTPWLAIVCVGAAFVVFWTAIVPLYERLVL
ncbi:hypothetical protein [Halosolutus gelatinilyticus]|uniref:hypothetical protein n=1 Tax=Halosolutus gelatinilyticus TaxID=2931975 RepID=UPI001FF3BF78|nr:hypothetical protein [Halosolutus gelatinilyticus]